VDKLLLKAGRELLLETGAANLKVRQVAARAGVNLGMFHYHFRTREHFLTSVFQEIYEDFFKTFVLESSGTDSPLARLSRALTVMARFVRDNRPILLMLLMDCVQGNRARGESVPELSSTKVLKKSS
jgi:AcrR family transcriptional regulator